VQHPGEVVPVAGVNKRTESPAKIIQRFLEELARGGPVLEGDGEELIQSLLDGGWVIAGLDGWGELDEVWAE